MLVGELETWIAQHKAGEKLPSSREITRSYSVSPVTVRNAIHELATRGLVEVRVGVGVFVRHRQQLPRADFSWQVGALGPQPNTGRGLAATQRASTDEAISLHSGYPDESLLPTNLVRRALTRVSKSYDAYRRAPVRGMAELRQWFASQLVRANERDVVIVPGTQSGLGAIFRAISPKELIIESPSYWGAILAARQAGISLLPVESDDEGPIPESLERLLRTSSARAFYGQPTFGNPHGKRWSTARRKTIIEIIRAFNAFLIEDDWAHDFAFDAPDVPIAADDAEGHVIYLRSLTKVISPAVRVGAVIAKGPVLQRILAEVSAEALYTSGILQAVALDVVKQSAYATHLKNMQVALRQRRNDLLEALSRYAPSVETPHVPQGGLNLWCRLPDGTDPQEVAERCEGRGLIVAPGRDWFPSEEIGPYLRLNFAGPHPERFVDAAMILDSVVSG